MVVTKTAAAKMWCPFARSLILGGNNRPGSANRESDYDGTLTWPKTSRCISDRCMAWRPFKCKTTGYCGLAGTPSDERP